LGTYPYLVMDWVEGESLYEWAERRNPSQRQVLTLLAQVARALEATHAAGGLHRDVKGSNVLVRLSDSRAFLTDFGAGDYRGAATLTSKLLPPGTSCYRSLEAWAFLQAFRRNPTAHYPASTCVEPGPSSPGLGGNQRRQMITSPEVRERRCPARSPAASLPPRSAP